MTTELERSQKNTCPECPSAHDCKLDPGEFCAESPTKHDASRYDSGMSCIACSSARDAFRFDGVVEMMDGSRLMGWPIQYRQLHMGKLTAWLKLQRCADVSLQYLYTAGRIEFEGSTSEDQVTIFISIGQGPIWINGRTFDQTEAFVLNSNTRIHGVCPEGGRLLSMQVPYSKLRETDQNGIDSWQQRIARIGNPVTAGFTLLHRLKSQMLSTICHPGVRRGVPDRGLELASLLAAVIQQGGHTALKVPRDSKLEAMRTISCANQYIEGNLAEHITMTDVCNHASASLSKLERTFRRELKVSPSQYILSRRLNRVHRELKRADANTTRIVHIAMDNGFKHLGRFSAYYRTQFGELPSQTLGSVAQ